MKRYCHISSCPRTGSTYLNILIANQDNCINLSECFNFILHMLPFKKTQKEGSLVWKIKGYNLYDLIKKEEFKTINSLVLNNWKDDWFYNKYKIKNGILKIKKSYKPLIILKNTHQQVLINMIEIIKNLKQDFILKIRPGHILEIKNLLKINFIELLKTMDVQFITSERKSMLDLCISFAFSDYSRIYNLFDPMLIEEFSKPVTLNLNTIDLIFQELVEYNRLKLTFPEDVVNFHFETLFKNKRVTLKSLGIKYNKSLEKENYLPRKLYPNFNRLEKLELIKNKNEFLEHYNRILKKQED